MNIRFRRTPIMTYIIDFHSRCKCCILTTSIDPCGIPCQSSYLQCRLKVVCMLGETDSTVSLSKSVIFLFTSNLKTIYLPLLQMKVSWTKSFQKVWNRHRWKGSSAGTEEIFISFLETLFTVLVFLFGSFPEFHNRFWTIHFCNFTTRRRTCKDQETTPKKTTKYRQHSCDNHAS